MDASFDPAVDDLPEGAVRSYAGHAGGSMTVLEGRVWLTEPNDPKDHVLQGGESFSFNGRGPIVVEALSHASVLLLSSMEHCARSGGRRLPELLSTSDGRPVLLREVAPPMRRRSVRSSMACPPPRATGVSMAGSRACRTACCSA